MNVQMFNGWWFLFVFLSFASVAALFFILRNRSDKTKKIVLFLLLAFGLALHFLKLLFPPFSTDQSRALRDSWFVNICAANIAIFPFIFLSKNKTAKDYMFYLGILGGLVAVLYPLEVIQKQNQSAVWFDILRFYIHHTILWSVPLLMVLFKLHKLDYRRVIFCPIWLMGVMLFIICNQVLQSELGIISIRGTDILSQPYANPSKIWGPGNDGIGKFLALFCPKVFKKIPFGAHAGETKYWPWFWLLVPAFVILTPLTFLICLCIDWKHFVNDCNRMMIRLHWKKDDTVNQFGFREIDEKTVNKIISKAIKKIN